MTRYIYLILIGITWSLSMHEAVAQNCQVNGTVTDAEVY